jgi:hypothetical protein
MSIRSIIQHIGIITLLSLLYSISASATQSPEPSRGKTLLTLHWVDAQGTARQTRLNLEDLDALPQSTLTLELSETFGIKGRHSWQGISLQDLLKLIDSKGQSLRLQALNGYYATLPISDVERFNPVLAYRRDGHNLTIREKGPFILIYPFNKFKELGQQIYINRSVWQINEIYIE